LTRLGIKAQEMKMDGDCFIMAIRLLHPSQFVCIAFVL
jgi:hypothetical protein